MALRTLKELRDNIASTVRETQVSSLIDGYLNLTLSEIHNFHPWTWLRRKQTFATVASQEDYNLDEEVDRIALIRQIATPHKLLYVPDHLFYQLVPDPENGATGVPYYYRLWEETGFATNLAADDTVYVVSSATQDGADFKVTIEGRNASGEIVREVLTLNGTTNVTSSTTWDASGLMQISKSAKTTGTITCYRTTGATQLTEMAPDETAPRFKRISLYPIPSAAVTTYLEYFERLRYLVNDSDIPQMDTQWNWVLREGALTKMWAYKQNEAATSLSQQAFLRGLMQMRQQDERNMDFIPVLQPRAYRRGIVRHLGDSVNNEFPIYAVSAW